MTTTNGITNNTRIAKQAADQKMADGFAKHAQTIPALIIAGTSYKATDIASVLQARVSTATAVQSSRALWQNAVKADTDERAKTKPIIDGVRQALLVALAGSIDGLADFGLTPRKVRVVTPEKKAIAAAKAKATREARGTKGSVQKKGVKGAVNATLVVTPIAGPPPVVTAPAPATPPVQATTPAPVGGTTPHAS